MASTNLVSLVDVSVYKNNQAILSNISLDITRNSLITLIGNNGAGKSTLSKVIIGSIKPNKGNINKENNLKISYVPQKTYYNSIIPLRVIDFLALHNHNSYSTDILNYLKINSLLYKQFKHLSGGEQQRVIIARAIIKKPDLLILDEPTSFIDFASKNSIYNLINDIRKQQNFSVILVSHDLNLVLKDTDLVVCLVNGKIGCSGTALDISKNDIIKQMLVNKISYYTHKE